MSLTKASKDGNLELVKKLISQGEDLHALGDLALSLASRNGYLEIVTYLISQGADIHAKNDRPLRWASKNGQLEVVKYLVSQGANIHAKDDGALRWASSIGNLDVVKYLISQGAEINDNALRNASLNVKIYLEKVIRERKLRVIRERIALRVIKNGIHNWLYKPLCDDDTIGIVPRLY